MLGIDLFLNTVFVLQLFSKPQLLLVVFNGLSKQLFRSLSFSFHRLLKIAAA